MVLTVAALMAATMAIAGPAKADVIVSGGSFGGGNSSNFNSGSIFISVDSDFDDIDFGGIEFDGNGDFEID
ncbi:MAG: hypothetical protein M3N18_02880 [Actinomycetota bacterium]|nr:hypothetical protein [Actinomycetota bacterium]